MGNYMGQTDKLRQIFDLLDKDHNHLLDGHELQGILGKREIEQMMNETATHRAQFTADQMAETAKKGLRNEFKKLCYRAKSSKSQSIDQILQNERTLKNKLTFDEFCHL